MGDRPLGCPVRGWRRHGRAERAHRGRGGRLRPGVAIRPPRGQLFEAAERILLRDAPAGLTSRSVTAEAGVAKGVLHRHFADFDDFLTELALDRIAAIGAQADGLQAAAGTGSVTSNLTGALTALFSSVA